MVASTHNENQSSIGVRCLPPVRDHASDEPSFRLSSNPRSPRFRASDRMTTKGEERRGYVFSSSLLKAFRTHPMLIRSRGYGPYRLDDRPDYSAIDSQSCTVCCRREWTAQKGYERGHLRRSRKALDQRTGSHRTKEFLLD
jgi:hypothetical protein